MLMTDKSVLEYLHRTRTEAQTPLHTVYKAPDAPSGTRPLDV